MHTEWVVKLIHDERCLKSIASTTRVMIEVSKVQMQMHSQVTM